MPNVEADFNRAQTTQRVTTVIMLFGVLASLVMAFPMMMGINRAIGDGRPLFFFVPFTLSLVLTALIRWARK